MLLFLPKTFPPVVRTNTGATKRVPKRVTETVAICKVTVSWATYWLSDITR